MKRLSISFGILILTFIWIYNTAATGYNPPINPIIGDISYVIKFGSSPTADTDKNLRVKTHLEYAEKLLRKTQEVVFAEESRQKRLKALNFLHQYHTTGNYMNFDYQNIKNGSFLKDENGNFSALGFLVEKTSGEHVVNQIIHEVKTTKDTRFSPTLTRWLANNGLTKEEAAIIQIH